MVNTLIPEVFLDFSRLDYKCIYQEKALGPGYAVSPLLLEKQKIKISSIKFTSAKCIFFERISLEKVYCT